MLLTASPDQLTLKERKMIIREFVSKPKHKNNQVKKIKTAINQTESDALVTNENNSQEDEMSAELNINDLPLDLLANIFSRLSLRELCLAEKGNFFIFKSSAP